MNKSNILGLVLIFALLSVFFWWSNKTAKEKQLNQQQQTDSIAKVKQIIDSIKLEQIIQAQVNDTTPSLSSNLNEALKDKYGVFSSSAMGDEHLYYVETDKFILTFSNLGGKLYSVQLKEFTTYDKQPLILFEGNTNKFGISFFVNNRLANSEKLYFSVFDNENSGDSILVSNEGGYDLKFRLYPENNSSVERYIEYAYHIPKDDYLIDIDVNFVGMQNIISVDNGFVDLTFSVDMRQQEKSKESRLNGNNIYYRYKGDKDVDKLTENKDASKNLPTYLQWVSFKQQFFTSSLIAKDSCSFMSGVISSEKDKLKETHVARYIKTMKAQLLIPFHGYNKESFNMSMYFGPNKFKDLKKYDIKLENQIFLGSFFLIRWINRFVVIPVFNFLEGFNWNYGLVILVLTLLLKIVLFPITYKSYLSGAKMRAIKPEIDALSEKYPNKDDAMKKQQESMALYKKFGINPMSGCLPQLLQFPILIAMFRFFPVSFELRQQPFLWAKDLSTYDSILDLPFNIPFYGDHVSLFTLLMTISTIIYTRVNNNTMGQTNQPGMKFMLYAMPVMFLGFFNSYSAGLSYYYFLANIITFAQMFLIGRLVPNHKLREKLLLVAASNKNKSPKKSNWQQRLEAMQKKQQAMARENAKRKR